MNREKIRRTAFFMVQAALSPLEWLVFIPLSFLVPKSKKRIAFIGGFDGRFSDNVKYLYLYVSSLNKTNLDCFFVTGNRQVYRGLKKIGINAVLYPTPNSLIRLLTAHLIVVDNMDWIWGGKYHLLFKSKKVQLWHGAGLKNIELDTLKMRMYLKKPFLLRTLVRIYCSLIGRFPNYDLLISTSTFFTKNFFLTPFRTGHIEETGYPRNDIMLSEQKYPGRNNYLKLISSDTKTIAYARQMQQEGCKIILYAPTYRNTCGDPIKAGILDPERLGEFGKKNSYIFVIKFHPNLKHDLISGGKKNVLYYDYNLDVYPLLAIVDLLITDYSSIYVDFLLLDKPIIFFPYDYDEYIKNDRELKFDYHRMTPGPKCYSQPEVEDEIVRTFVDGDEKYSEERGRIRQLAFKYRDDKAAERVWDVISNRYL